MEQWSKRLKLPAAASLIIWTGARLISSQSNALMRIVGETRRHVESKEEEREKRGKNARLEASRLIARAMELPHVRQVINKHYG